ncbi:ATP-binding protein [Filifactor alocis]|uniref:ATP-binding protein n=1 Tax=Filifactor alocis TaxID=143361 RepID=UPI0028EE76FF|nr:4Fe-4S binding protein [Filifactor alocis]
MIRKIIKINEDKCDGCGLCVTACHEGAIDIIDGKAKLTRESFCDGLGDCLPNCPQGAITFEEREAPAYDEEAVKKMQQEKAKQLLKENSNMTEHEKMIQIQMSMHAAGQGCPGSRFITFDKPKEEEVQTDRGYVKPVSRLGQWPCQIKLVPVQAPFFNGAKLLIAADCTAFAYANLHDEFMKGKITLIGCPKLDEGDYSEKLTQIIAENDIKSVTVVRMEVPCCGGMQRATETALRNSGKFIPWQIITITRDGKILDL